MASLRSLTIISATVVAGLMLATVPGRSQPTGAPLSLTPLAYAGQAAHRGAKARKPQHATRRSATPRALARSQSDRNVIRVPGGVSLTSLLPWWRADELQTIRYRERADESQVLSAADAWFAALGVEKTTAAESDYALASPDDVNELDLAANGMAVADPDEANAIDLAADGAPQEEHKSWLSILLASLGGALAVASTARFLFV